MPTSTNLMKRGTAVFFAGSMLFGVAACGDDDTDGDTNDELQQDIDEGVDDVEEKLDDAGDEIEQQIDEGTEEDGEGE